jgi:RND family efflux transporter MFP subunit
MKVSFMLALCLAAPAAAANAPSGEDAAPPIKAITAPSEDLTLAFTQPGRVAKVLVREGQHVKAGQLLVQLDDTVERVQLSLLKAKAENMTAIKAAELRLARARVVLKKVQEAYDGKAAPERELEDARIDVAMTELDLQVARFNHEQDKGRHQEAGLLLERMSLVSPTEAEVERIYRRVGEAVGVRETADARTAVVRLVRIDPLWIDVPAPTAQARRLARGQTALVRFAEAESPVKAEVIRVSKVADAASETLEVRLELANPTGRPAGEQVTVCFPAAGK